MSSSLRLFHPAVQQWFSSNLGYPTPAQDQAWPLIKQKLPTLIAAPTGSGKTLAAFLSSIDDLIRLGLNDQLEEQTYVLYLSPLKALSNDIQKNLQNPLNGIQGILKKQHQKEINIDARVRTGDTSSAERRLMAKRPPHILITTPESLFILLTSQSGRKMLQTVETLIVDEIHAVISEKRGAHLALSLERLQSLVSTHKRDNAPIIRIGLSATQKPIELVAKYLMGSQRDLQACNIVDSGSQRHRDLDLIVPGSPLSAVMANEVWPEIYRQLLQLIESHSTTLIFVNNRRLAERASRVLSETLGDEAITSHHGSLAKEHRFDAEQRLKSGQLKALVATASLELGIDIGDIDLVCQIGSPHNIASFLQRVGRSGHSVGGLPKGRLFPLSRDDLVECTALLQAVNQGELDELFVPPGSYDVLSQQLIAEISQQTWQEEALFKVITSAYPFRDLKRENFQQILSMLTEGFSTRRGHHHAYLFRDEVNGILKGRKGASLTAVTNAGAIPDLFDYDVIMEPHGLFIGTLNEDFAFESLPGDIFQLGNTSYRILRIERGAVRVQDAQGLPPNIPFWFGDAPGRSDALSQAVSKLREDVQNKLSETGLETCVAWLKEDYQLNDHIADQLAEYLSTSFLALKTLPKREEIVFERFFDEVGDQHIVIHSPYGSRINRAWGLALRKKFCRKFNFELQAAALEDSIVISLGETHSFPLEEVVSYVKAKTLKKTLEQAILQTPLFETRWRWVASISLAIQKFRNGKRVPAQFQRMNAEDLISVVFPDQIACQDNVVGEREIPDHPLVFQSLYDCLYDAMDIQGLEALLHKIEDGTVHIRCCDLSSPSPLAQEILLAKPYAFLDDAPAEERRTQAVHARRFMTADEASDLNQLSPEAIQQVADQVKPRINSPDELHDTLMRAIIWPEDHQHSDSLSTLIKEKRACLLTTEDNSRTFWVCAERLPIAQAMFPKHHLSPIISAVGKDKLQTWSLEDALIVTLRGHLGFNGPISEQQLSSTLNLPISSIHIALIQLETQGYAMQGQFVDPDDKSWSGKPSSGKQKWSGKQWCERGLLARIHRYTLKSLRASIQAVPISSFMAFLCEWQGLIPCQPPTLSSQQPFQQPSQQHQEKNKAQHLAYLHGEISPKDYQPVPTTEQSLEKLALCLQQLEGFRIPASTWEQTILPSRLTYYSSQWLDQMCGSGQFIWTRIPHYQTNANQQKIKTQAVKSTPIILIERQHAHFWITENTIEQQRTLRQHLTSTAQLVLELLEHQGPAFFNDIVAQSRLLKTQVEKALGELVANGFVNSDHFFGLRALCTPSSATKNSRKSFRSFQNRRRSHFLGNTSLPSRFEQAGRWTLLSSHSNDLPEENQSEKHKTENTGKAGKTDHVSSHQTFSMPIETLEYFSSVLLERYGIVFHRLLEREQGLPPWRELLYAFRRMEARGDVRGGRFVEGVYGEQFALPQAVEQLRHIHEEQQKKDSAPNYNVISAADPLNLTGFLLPGQRIPALTTHKILLTQGIPVAFFDGHQVFHYQMTASPHFTEIQPHSSTEQEILYEQLLRQYPSTVLG